MPDIIRIIIKGASGYGPVDEAYEDNIEQLRGMAHE